MGHWGPDSQPLFVQKPRKPNTALQSHLLDSSWSGARTQAPGNSPCSLPNAAPDRAAAPSPSPQFPWRLGPRSPEGAPPREPTGGPGSCTQRQDPGPAAPTWSFSGCAGTWRPPRPRPLRPGEPGAPGWASRAAATACVACLASLAALGVCGRPVRPPNPLWAPDPACLPPQAFPRGSQGAGPEGPAQTHSA